MNLRWCESVKQFLFRFIIVLMLPLLGASVNAVKWLLSVHQAGSGGVIIVFMVYIVDF